MNRAVIWLILITTLANGASAQSMNAQLFHKRAVALKSKGPLAMLSRGEIRALMAEGQAAGMMAREQRLAAIKAGRTPPYCPPHSKEKIASSEFMSRLASIPAPDRARMNMTQAMTMILAGKFPCPG